MTEAVAARGDRARDVISVIALLIVLAIAAILRVRYADAFASYDELWHLALSTGHGTPLGQFGTDVIAWQPRSQTSMADALPAWHVWTTLDVVLHPPLYFVTLRLWRDVFGEGEAAARSLSNVCSLVAIAFGFLTVRSTVGRTLAVIAALTMAIAPTQVYFGQEIRGYAMLIAIASAGLWLMTRIELDGPTRRRAIALALVPLAMLLTHYLAFGAAIAIAIFGLWRLAGHRRAFVAALAGTATIYAIIWLPFAMRQVLALDTGDSFLHVDHRVWGREIALFLAAPIRQLIDRPLGRDGALLATSIVFVVPWLLLRRAAGLRPAALWMCGTLGALLALDAARDTEHFAYVRYTATAGPAVLPLMIGSAAALRRWAAHAVAVTLLLASAVYLHGNAGVAADSPGFGDLARAVAARVGPGEPIITCRGGRVPHYAGQVMQLHLSHVPGFLPRPLVDLSKPMSRDVADQLPRHAWLIAIEYDDAIADAVPGATVVWGLGVAEGIMLYEIELAPLPTATASRMPSSAPASSRCAAIGPARRVSL